MMIIKTVSDLKAQYEANSENGLFFSRKTLAFFGDTMSNFGMSRTTIKVRRHSGEVVDCFHVYRKKTTPKGCPPNDFYFDTEKCQLVHGEVTQ